MCEHEIKYQKKKLQRVKGETIAKNSMCEHYTKKQINRVKQKLKRVDVKITQVQTNMPRLTTYHFIRRELQANLEKLQFRFADLQTLPPQFCVCKNVPRSPLHYI
jgi:DNA repair exonuclease SbcCD ATPase subunit